MYGQQSDVGSTRNDTGNINTEDQGIIMLCTFSILSILNKRSFLLLTGGHLTGS